MAYKQKTKLTPKNFRKLGYDYHYKMKGKNYYTTESKDGIYETIYDSKGKKIGEFS